MAYLPGEKMLLELVQKGQDSHQAVGYLTDGTMVVVEHAFKQIGQTVEIEFIRSLQTAAGKMMFAKPTASPVAKKQSTVQQAIEKLPMTKSAVKKKQAGRAPKPAASPEVAVSPAVFHSDSTEHRKATAVRRSKADNHQPAKHDAHQRQASKQTQQRADDSKSTTRPRQQRPKTSAQREAALIDLVDKQ
jgi:hypothetical protein